MSLILTWMVVLSAVAILLEAALAFLGVGILPANAELGQYGGNGEMVGTGKEYLYDSATYAVLPGLMLALTILAFDTIGRALSAALEGREAREGRPVATRP